MPKPPRNITLELSLKPFHDPSDAAVRAVVSRLLSQWEPLYKDAEQLSFLLWSADGSEILDYRGDLEAPFEWAYWIGTANPYRKWPHDPEGRCPHSAGHKYIENPPTLTYGWLRNLVSIIKELGSQTGKQIRVGATFDPGPEFAKSSFKYERHRELLGEMWHGTFIYCYAKLEPDSEPYAGFPNGIPEGVSFGAFLGRQTKHFAQDLGFDYLWLSNGFGFGMETWTVCGALFDGKTFKTEGAKEIGERSLGFWRDLRKEIPDMPIETRGTNQSTGVDLASDATPMGELYKGGFDFVAPPNSPWAALNGDFGTELMGWMSHIAELPSKGYPFRFYTHDPWWLNSPWLDRYERQPHDIYLPMSVCRLTEAGDVELPDRIEFLTVDDSYGRTPDQVPDEVIPHVKHARATGPDRPGTLVWIYPFEENNEWIFGDDARPERVMFGDRFIRSAINNGLPLNTVISTGNFVSSSECNPGYLLGSVLVTPAPDEGSEVSELILEHVRNGGKALLYGPLTHADPRLLEMLAADTAEPLDGKFELDLPQYGEAIEAEWVGLPRVLSHESVLSGGGLAETPTTDAAWSITARQGGEVRLLATFHAPAEWNGGGLGWVRGSEIPDPSLYDAEHRAEAQSEEAFPASIMMRAVLSKLGYQIVFTRPEPKLLSPVLTVSRNGNAYYFSGYMPNTLVDVSLRFPHGAPLLTNADAVFRNGFAHYRFPRAFRHICRAFVEQEDGIVTAHEIHPTVPGVTERLRIDGLKNATITFCPVPGFEDKVEMLRDPVYPYFLGDFLKPTRHDTPAGVILRATNVTGAVMISW